MRRHTKKDTKKERFKSNKGKNHGYGLSIVKDTVKENNGYFEIMDNGNTVSVVIVLPARKE
ncbi:MAG: GHKL domain-containing protein [Solobacterium sp.]|jgi:sensor histidine kinase regulating citrate/malate metabolism|nr:GHKL domain-containing protein [Solobacterium sp.]MCH4048956.1 GHKL domain-containing protein [Solobacterium sp.]MCH4074290.1 GHKL domain-containing protein [Solobacterium sp.]